MQPASSCSFPRKLGLEAVEPIEKALQSFHGFLSVRTTKVATTVSTTVPTIVRKIASSGSVPPLTWIVLAYACVARTRTGSDTNSLFIGRFPAYSSSFFIWFGLLERPGASMRSLDTRSLEVPFLSRFSARVGLVTLRQTFVRRRHDGGNRASW